MTDNRAKFYEVNIPRMEKVMHTLNLIDKSAKSYRVDVDARQFVMEPLHDYMQTEIPDQSEALTAAAEEAKMVDAALEASPGHINAQQRPAGKMVEYKRDRIKDLPTTDLIDLMLACGVEVAERRK